MTAGPVSQSEAADAVRAAVLIHQPIQHFAPGLRLLTQRADLRLRVHYWNAPADGVYDHGFGRHIRWSTDLFSGYNWWAPPAEAGHARRRIAAWRCLRAYRPEVILCFGWASQIAQIGIAYALSSRTPLLYYGDTNGRASAGGRHPRLRRAVLRRLLGEASGAVSTGAFNREFYLAHGLAAERIHPGVCPTDVDLFHAAGDNRRIGLREGPEDRPVVIGFAGKLIPIKAAHDLIEAAARLPRAWSWELRLIGDGPLRLELESAIEAHGLVDRVRFLGFRNTDELPSLMSEIDIMVTPSRREARGLVPIEAMAAGAAVIVSSATGVWGPGDAVQHGRTGLVYPVGDIAALAGCIRRLVDDSGLRQRLADAGRARVRSLGPADFAATVAQALVTTAGKQAAGVDHR